MLDEFARKGWALLLDASLRSLFLLAVAGLALLCLRRSSAAVRHLVLLLTLACLLFLPLVSVSLPGWKVAVWPHTTVVMPPLVNPPDVVPVMPAPGKIAAPVSSATPPVAVAAPISTPLRAPSPPVEKPHTFPWPQFAVCLWAAGVCVVLVPVLAGLVGIRRLGRRSLPVTMGVAFELASDLERQLGLYRRVVRLRQSVGDDSPVVPMTWGWLQPVILLPSGAEEWLIERLRVVLLHELAHIQRRDWLWQMLAHVVCTLYWFHPGVWLVARQLRLESERACDDQVLSAGIPAPDYARHLVEVARSLSQGKPHLGVALPMAQTSQIESRLRAILRPGGRQTFTRRGTTFAVLMTMAVLMPIALLHSAPASARLLTSSFPTPSFVEASVKSALLYNTLPSDPTWTRRIGKGVAVELIGVSALTAQRKWCRPDGQLMTQNLHEDTPTPFFRDNLGGHKTIEFAFRVTNATGQAVNVDYNVPGSSSQGSETYEGENDEADLAYAATDERRINHKTNGFRLLGVGLPIRATHVTVRVGIASGPWKDAFIWPWPSQTGGYSTTTLAGVFAFSSIIEANKQSTLTITDTALRQDFQVIAIDQQGHEQTAFSAHSVTNGPFRQTTVTFNLPFSQIKTINFQIRPYKWVEFKNVSLNPSAHVAQLAETKGSGYNFIWGKVPGNPDKAVAQMKRFYQWITIYRNGHDGAYPVGLTRLYEDMRNHPEEYGFPAEAGSDSEVTAAFMNPDVRYSNLRSMGSSLIPYVMLQPYRLDGTLLGSAKAPGTKDVLAYTDIYVHQNWSHGIPTTQTGFYPVLWDDGTVSLIPWDKILRVPYMPEEPLHLKPVTAVVVANAIKKHGMGSWTYVFPGQAGIPANALTLRQYQHL